MVTSPVLLSQILKDKDHFPNRSQTGIRDIVPLGLLGMTTEEPDAGLWAGQPMTTPTDPRSLMTSPNSSLSPRPTCPCSPTRVPPTRVPPPVFTQSCP